MKKLSFLALAAAGMLMVGCADKDVVNEMSGQKTAFDDAFIGISIQLTSSSNTTRANEDLEDGENEEFAVNDATLYIFKSLANETEAQAKYVGSYTMGTDFKTDPGTLVTSTYCEATRIDNKLAEEISESAEGVKYYAYVVVNNNGQIAPLDESVTFAKFSKREFTGFGSPVAAEKNIGQGGLLMTNAPVCKAQGGLKSLGEGATEDEINAKLAPLTSEENYYTLVELDKKKIFANATDAKNSPAGCVYVERAAVKITVNNNITPANAEDIATNPETDPIYKVDNGTAYELDGWQIINYEPTYYNTRQIHSEWGSLATTANPADFALFNGVAATNTYRFVSYRPFDPNLNATHTNQPYRTFFAEDVQYDKEATLMKPQAQVDGTWIEADHHGYTTENTFDVVRQKWNNTTMVTLRAKFNGGAGFYMTSDIDGILPTEAEAETAIAAYISKLPAVQNLIQTGIDNMAEEGKTYEANFTAQIILPSGATEPNAGVVTYSADFTLTATNGGSKTKNDLANLTAIQQAIADAVDAYKVNYYLGGYAYYNVRIKHFGDYETPWSATKPYQTQTPGTTVDQIYGATSNPNYEKNFLGRYGVVRDNWYKLSIDKIGKIGSAVPVDVSGTGKDTPDDEIENYISVHVHIVPWVIRNQSVEF